MKDYQQKVVNEKVDLDLKIQKLVKFMYADDDIFDCLSGRKQLQLTKQLAIMSEYSSLLGGRIKEFE